MLQLGIRSRSSSILAFVHLFQWAFDLLYALKDLIFQFPDIMLRGWFIGLKIFPELIKGKVLWILLITIHHPHDLNYGNCTLVTVPWYKFLPNNFRSSYAYCAVILPSWSVSNSENCIPRGVVSIVLSINKNKDLFIFFIH